MWTPPTNVSTELTRGAIYLILYSGGRTSCSLVAEVEWWSCSWSAPWCPSSSPSPTSSSPGSTTSTSPGSLVREFLKEKKAPSLRLTSLPFSKGTLPWDFRLQEFSWIIFPQAPEYPIRTVSKFFECLSRQPSLVINIVGTDDICRLPRRMME
jgi:hypothetical protein